MPTAPPPHNSLHASGRLNGYSPYRMERPKDAPRPVTSGPIIVPIGPSQKEAAMSAAVALWKTLSPGEIRTWIPLARRWTLSTYQAFLRFNMFNALSLLPMERTH